MTTAASCPARPGRPSFTACAAPPDPQLRELVGPTGPFASCTEDRQFPVKALLTNQPPKDHLNDV